MKKKNYKSSSVLRSILPGLCAFIFIAAMVISGLKDTRASVDEEGMRLAKESISRAVITCYAIENRYPQNFEYLKEYYGISIDESRYVVHYSAFAENLMPDVTIVRR